MIKKFTKEELLERFGGSFDNDDIIKFIIYEKIPELGGAYEALLNSKEMGVYPGRILAYSGPKIKLRELLKHSIGNHERAKEQATDPHFPAVLIDDVHVGKFIFDDNAIYQLLDFKHSHLPKDIKEKAKQKDADYINSIFSALFIRAAHGHVDTAVCGADRERIFYMIELPGLVDRDNVYVILFKDAKNFVDMFFDNKDIKTINGLDIEHCRKMFNEKGQEEVFRLICRMEKKKRLHKAIKTENEEDFKKYLEVKELYRQKRELFQTLKLWYRVFFTQEGKEIKNKLLDGEKSL